MIMTNFTPQQKRVLNTIKVFQAEYTEGVPYNILKLDLDIPEEYLNPILDSLEEGEYISRDDGLIIFQKEIEKEEKAETSDGMESVKTSQLTNEDKLMESSADDVADKSDVNDVDVDNVSNTENNADVEDLNGVEVKNELSETAQQSLEIIGKVVDDSGNISRTLLEGTLLYGELELTSIRMYNLITSLENKGILRKIQLVDGEYYQFTP